MATVQKLKKVKRRNRPKMHPKIKQMSKLELQKMVISQSDDIKTKELRLYEATRLHKDLVVFDSPNTRNHWQARPLRAQARHLYENDPIAKRVIDSIVCNMIGKGITPMARGPESSKQYEMIVEKFFYMWRMSTMGDFDDEHNLCGIQSLVVKALVRDGAVFVRRVIDEKGRLTLQILEHDYLDVSRGGTNPDTSNEIINGIEYSHTGKVVAYWLWENHPEDVLSNPGLGGHYGSTPIEISGPTSVSVSRGRALRIPYTEICHIKKIDRPGQQDGVSWLAPALVKLWDLREYEEARLKQQKLQASFTAFVKDNYALSEEERMDLLGDEGSSIGGREVSPGHIEELPPGKDVTFPTSSNIGNEKFVERCLRSIAGALGVSYEIFNDYSLVNYSSGRMGFLEMDRHLKHILHTVIEPQFLCKIGNWAIDYLVTQGYIPRNHGIYIEWTPSAREMIDPLKESQALSAMVGANLISMRQAHASMGQDFDQVIDDIERSNAKMKAAGLEPLIAAQGGAITEGAMGGEAKAEEPESNPDTGE